MKMLVTAWHNTFLVVLVAVIGILVQNAGVSRLLALIAIACPPTDVLASCTLQALPVTIGRSPSVIALDHWLHTFTGLQYRADTDSMAEELSSALRKRSEYAPALDVDARTAVKARDKKPPPSSTKKSGILNRPWKRVEGGGSGARLDGESFTTTCCHRPALH